MRGESEMDLRKAGAKVGWCVGRWGEEVRGGSRFVAHRWGKNVTPRRSFVGLRCFFQHLARLMHAAACMAASDRYNPKRFPYPFSAEVAKSVDAVDSKSTVEIRAGSSPAFGTIRYNQVAQGRLFLCLLIYRWILITDMEALQKSASGIGLMSRVALIHCVRTVMGAVYNDLGHKKWILIVPFLPEFSVEFSWIITFS